MVFSKNLNVGHGLNTSSPNSTPVLFSGDKARNSVINDKLAQLNAGTANNEGQGDSPVLVNASATQDRLSKGKVTPINLKLFKTATNYHTDTDDMALNLEGLSRKKRKELCVRVSHN